MLFGENIQNLSEPLLILAGFVVGLFILSWFTREFKRMRYSI